MATFFNKTDNQILMNGCLYKYNHIKIERQKVFLMFYERGFAWIFLKGETSSTRPFNRDKYVFY